MTISHHLNVSHSLFNCIPVKLNSIPTPYNIQKCSLIVLEVLKKKCRCFKNEGVPESNKKDH